MSGSREPRSDCICCTPTAVRSMVVPSRATLRGFWQTFRKRSWRAPGKNARANGLAYGTALNHGTGKAAEIEIEMQAVGPGRRAGEVVNGAIRRATMQTTTILNWAIRTTNRPNLARPNDPSGQCRERQRHAKHA